MCLEHPWVLAPFFFIVKSDCAYGSFLVKLPADRGLVWSYPGLPKGQEPGNLL